MTEVSKKIKAKEKEKTEDVITGKSITIYESAFLIQKGEHRYGEYYIDNL